MLQAMSQGARTVVVPEGGLSDKGMDALGRALGQHPRIIFFAVYDWRGEASTLPADARRALALAQGEEGIQAAVLDGWHLLFCLQHMHADCRYEGLAILLYGAVPSWSVARAEDLMLLRCAEGGNNWPSNANLMLMVDGIVR